MHGEKGGKYIQLIDLIDLVFTQKLTMDKNSSQVSMVSIGLSLFSTLDKLINGGIAIGMHH